MRALSCAEALALADAALDGPLDGPGSEALLSSHLDACPGCAAAAAEGERLHASLLALRGPEPGPSFTDRVIGALDRGPHGGDGEAPPARAPARWLRAAVAVVGTASVAAAAFLLLPVEEAAAAVAERVPALASPVPALAGIGDPLLPWAAPAAAAALLGAMLVAGAGRLLRGAR